MFVDVSLAYTFMVAVLDVRKHTGSLFIITTFLTIPKLRRVFALQLVFFMAICELVNAFGVMIGACTQFAERQCERACMLSLSDCIHIQYRQRVLKSECANELILLREGQFVWY